MSEWTYPLWNDGQTDYVYKVTPQRDLQLTLSISLHAPNDAIRDKLMPVNKAYPLKQLIPACRQYFKATGRRISFEYAMIRDVNDMPGTAVRAITHSHVTGNAGTREFFLHVLLGAECPPPSEESVYAAVEKAKELEQYKK